MSIDLLIKENKCYSSEFYWAKCFQKALKNSDIDAPIISLEESMSYYLHKLSQNPPSWMFSFYDLLGVKKPLSDLFNVPQFLWNLEGRVSSCVHTLESEYSYIGFTDPYIVKQLNHKRTFVIPPPIESLPLNFSSPLFEVVLFEPLVDYERKKKLNSSLFGKEVEMALSSVIESSIEHPIEGLKKHSSSFSISKNDWMYALEEGSKALEVQKLIQSFSIPLHVFGEHVGKKWYRRLPNSGHIYLHSPLPFLERFEVLHRSRFLVVHCWKKEEGYPFWFLAAASCGALPLIPYSKDRKELIGDLPIVYHDLKELKERICDLRANEQKRRSIVCALKEKVEKFFSWDVVLKQLFERINAL